MNNLIYLEEVIADAIQISAKATGIFIEFVFEIINYKFHD